MVKGVNWNNRKIIKAARQALVGGVDSPVRAFGYVGGDPVPIKSGRGSNVYDYDGNRYIDYVLSYGAMILGHGHPAVTAEVGSAAREGFAFGATSAKEVELAGLIRKAVPFIEKIRFVSSGTEAVMGAVRVARGYTGRKKIVKLVNAYHGHADYLLAKAGSGLATQGIPLSKGVPKEYLRHTIVLDNTNIDSVNVIFKKYNKEIAAVIVEPVGGNYGVIKPDVNFLRTARRLTKHCGSLLIFDEIITGFRFHYGSAADIFGVKPDIICFGKIIGGGLPVGAFAASKKIMSVLAPEGEVYQASTFAGNPVVMAAGTAALRRLHSIKKHYPQLSAMAKGICETLEREAAKEDVAVKAAYYGSMFSVAFAQKDDFRYFYQKLLSAGIFFAPSEYEANFVSFAHRRKDVERTKDAIKHVFHNWKKRG